MQYQVEEAVRNPKAAPTPNAAHTRPNICLLAQVVKENPRAPTSSRLSFHGRHRLLFPCDHSFCSGIGHVSCADSTLTPQKDTKYLVDKTTGGLRCLITPASFNRTAILNGTSH